MYIHVLRLFSVICRSQWRKCAAKIWAHHIFTTTVDDNASTTPNNPSTTVTVPPFNHGRDAILRELAGLCLTAHPSLCSLLGASRAPGCSVLLLESGKSDLLGVLNQGLVSRQIGFLAVEMLLALRGLHHAGLSHGDIKPDNILMMSSGHLKLLDLGMVTLHTIPNTAQITSGILEDPGNLENPIQIPETLLKEIPESYLSQWTHPQKFPSPIPLHLPPTPTPDHPPPTVTRTPISRLVTALAALGLPHAPSVSDLVAALLPPPQHAHIGTAAYLPPEAVWTKLRDTVPWTGDDASSPGSPTSRDSLEFPSTGHQDATQEPGCGDGSRTTVARAAYPGYHPYPPGDLWALGCILYIACCKRMHIQPKGSAELYRLSTMSAAAFKSLIGKGTTAKKEKEKEMFGGTSLAKAGMRESVLRRGKKELLSGKLSKFPKDSHNSTSSHAHFTSETDQESSIFSRTPHFQVPDVVDNMYEQHYPLPSVMPKLSPDDAVCTQVLDWRPESLPKSQIPAKSVVFGLLHPLPWLRLGVEPYTHNCSHQRDAPGGLESILQFMQSSLESTSGKYPYLGSEISGNLDLCSCCPLPPDVFYIPFTPLTRAYLIKNINRLLHKYHEKSSNTNDSSEKAHLLHHLLSQYHSLRTFSGIGMGTASAFGGLYRVDYARILSDPWLASVISSLATTAVPATSDETLTSSARHAKRVIESDRHHNTAEAVAVSETVMDSGVEPADVRKELAEVQDTVLAARSPVLVADAAAGDKAWAR